MSDKAPPPILTSVADWIGPYDAILCDIWGVLHNGLAAIPGAADACISFRKRGGTVLLISNAPRPAAAVAEMLLRFGITAASYDSILTSGDVTRDMLSARGATPVLHIGPDRDIGIIDGTGAQRVSEYHAQLVVNSGLIDDTLETPDDYRAQLRRLANRGLPMICANPDIKVERGTDVVWCAGALAALYQDLGGKVVYAGKPHAVIYDAARARLKQLRGKDVPNDRLLAVGDGLRTDIEGAAKTGIASLYVASAVHMHEPLSPASLTRVLATVPHAPSAATAALRW